MAISNDPLYPQLPLHLTAVCTAANTTLSDAADANVAELALPASFEAEGGQLVGLWAVPRATTTATVLYLYISTDNGTTKRLVGSALAAADTVSTTDAPTPVQIKDSGGTAFSVSNPLYLPAGTGSSKTKLYVGASVALAGGWAFHAQILTNAKAS